MPKSYPEGYNEQYQPRQTESPELPSVEATMAKSVSLAEHLLWQLGELSGPEHVKDISRAIIGNINDDGYLVATLEEIQAMGSYASEDIEAALKLVQRMDPVGVGARDLVECLRL